MSTSSKQRNRIFRLALVATLLLLTATSSRAQATKDSENVPEAPVPSRSLEDLNYLGGDASMPPLADSNIAVDSEFRHGHLDRILLITSTLRSMCDKLRRPTNSAQISNP